ncbi:MAG: DnaJ domain-containing protein [Polyangiaceae bacterium]
MSLVRLFQQAREHLGVPQDADAATIKRAYRTAVLAHPPDADPDGFRRAREAYELLTDPWQRVEELLRSRRPAIDPPPLPAAPDAAHRGELAIALLRLAALSVDTELLLGGAESSPPEKKAVP